MTDSSGVAATPLLVDIDGLQQRIDLPTTRGQRIASWVNVGLGAGYVLMALVLDGPRAVWLGFACGYLVFGILGLVLVPRAHLLLTPAGVRHVGALGRGRLTPWSAVAEVRPPDTFHPSSHLRGPGGRFAETTDLPGLAADDARELQRRLEAARTAAAEAERPQA
ncbi:hypothetical protein WDZ16_13230 [Pseudokineococcus marinus]|uniref:PH domain-containing protein n=1 Tax=Pseudokineococcus marinus TaxID=351215 RepID=A0A849BRR1_9ACTN|nr:hypothetical protein [Pseudokineococcus marinus]NNH23522.1 hypothetical protein [Pseudokineococcus marinus]